jgi:D-glycero-alpha-D-manno-heptose-7-phosphate kinase
MIHTLTPYRASLFGGGSDYPSWLIDNEGEVLSMALALYSHIFIRPLSPVYPKKYRLRYFQHEEANHPEEVKHPIIRHALNRWIASDPARASIRLDMIHSGDLPAMTGMGTSSSFTVGLVNALDGLSGNRRTKYSLAQEAIYIEQVMNRESVGSQDQIAAAFGGINTIKFFPQSRFRVIPIFVRDQWLRSFLSCLRLVFTDMTRLSSSVASIISENIKDRQHQTKLIIEQAKIAAGIIETGSCHKVFGEMLAEAWMLKKEISPNASNKSIDTLYEKLLKAGAKGGKLLGAGSGGFLLMYIPDENIHRFDHLTKNLITLRLEVDWNGSIAVAERPLR